MRKRLFRSLVASALAIALVTPTLGNSAFADHRSGGHGHGHWKNHDRHAGKRIVRKWRHRHYEYRHVDRRTANRFHRHGSYRRNDDVLIGSFLGAALGALLGTTLGRSMDGNDLYRVNHALETSPTGSAFVWQNANTGGAYRVTPTRTYQVAQNAYCREFVTWGMIGGYEEKMYGTACRQPDGSWATVK